MDLPLVYTTDKNSVKLGIITIKTIKIMSNENYVASGELPYHIINSMCPSEQLDTIKSLSLVDANRIVSESWKLTHRSDCYLAKLPCECGSTVLVKHDINIKYNKPDIYDRVHEFDGRDPVSLADRKFKVKFRPPPFSVFEQMLLKQSDSNDLLDLLMWLAVESIDGETNYDKDIDVVLYKNISKTIEPDIEQINNMFSASADCPKCGVAHTSQIGWHHAKFLQGE